MRINLMKSLLLSLGFIVAHMLLRPFGLGWLVTVAFIGCIAYMLWRAFQSKNQQTEDTPSSRDNSPSNEEAAERKGFWERMRDKEDHGEDARTRRDQEDRTRAQQQADCALTHEERVKFQDIVKGVRDAD